MSSPQRPLKESEVSTLPVKTVCGFSPNTSKHTFFFSALSRSILEKLYISQSITARQPLGSPLLFPGTVRNGSVSQLSHGKDPNDKAENSSESRIFFHYVKQSQSLCTSAASGKTVRSSYKGIGAAILVCAFQTSQKSDRKMATINRSKIPKKYSERKKWAAK